MQTLFLALVMAVSTLPFLQEQIAIDLLGPEGQLRRTVEVEIERLRKADHLSETSIESLRKTIEVPIKSMAQSWSEKGGENAWQGSLPAPIRNQIVLAVQESESGDVDRYYKDLKRRENQTLECGRSWLRVNIDRFFALSPDQQQAIDDYASKNWDPRWIRSLENPVPRKIDGLSLLPVKVMATLRPDQLAAVWRRSQLDSYRFVYETEEFGDDKAVIDAATTQYRAEVNDGVSLRVKELTELCGINDDQVRQLRIAGKGAAEDIVQRKIAVIRELLEAKRDGRVQPTFEMVEILSEVTMASLPREPRWKKFVAKILTPEQLALYDAYAAERKARTHDLQVRAMVSEITAKLALNGEQAERLIKLLKQNTQAIRWGISTHDCWGQLRTVLDEDYLEILSKEELKGLEDIVWEKAPVRVRAVGGAGG